MACKAKEERSNYILYYNYIVSTNFFVKMKHWNKVYKRLKKACLFCVFYIFITLYYIVLLYLINTLIDCLVYFIINYIIQEKWLTISIFIILSNTKWCIIIL